VYYCNVCDDPHLTAPDGGVVRCPACGHADPTIVIRPLFVVTGASGSGKTTIFPELLSRMAGWCAVFDVDWLIDPLSHAAKDGQIDWTAFADTWLHVAHGVAQNGLPTLLLAPFIPENLDDLPGRAWVGEIRYLVLDCPDGERPVPQACARRSRYRFSGALAVRRAASSKAARAAAGAPSIASRCPRMANNRW